MRIPVYFQGGCCLKGVLAGATQGTARARADLQPQEGATKPLGRKERVVSNEREVKKKGEKILAEAAYLK